MDRVLVRNGRLGFEDRVEAGDVLLVDGRVAAVGAGLEAPPEAAVVDAAGCFVLPGFIDLHTHLDDRIGRFELGDTYLTGTAAAVQNGVTTLFSFVTQGPEETLGEAIDRVLGRAAGRCFCDVGWHLTPTRFDAAGWREVETACRNGWRTFKFYTTYKEAGIYISYARLGDLFVRLTPAGACFLVHCEDEDRLAAERDAGHDCRHAISHARLRPPRAERLAVERVLELADPWASPVHVVHVSTAAAARRIRAARARQPVTGETCPHYLFLDESWLRRPDGHRWICSPPLRRREQAAALCRAVREGCLDLLATDHCAFKCNDKDNNYSDTRFTPNGLAGIGALPHLAARFWSHAGTGLKTGSAPGPSPAEDVEARPGLTESAVPDLVRTLSANPARVAGVYPRKGALAAGSDADLVVLDPRGSARPITSSLAGVPETYPGFSSRLRFRAVFLRGRRVVRDGVLENPDSPGGESLCPR